MRARDRFEHTEPWGFSAEASGVRTRPDLELEIGPSCGTLKLDELDAPDTEHTSAGTALLAPAPAPSTGKPTSTALLAPLPQPSASKQSQPRTSTLPLARPIRVSSGAPLTRGFGAAPSIVAHPSAPPPAPARPYAAVPQAPLQAAVHASVYASVHAILLAASHLPRGSALPAPAPAHAPAGWTPAQRIYVLATAVALSVMATTIFFLAIGSSDAHGSRAPRTARISAAAVATLDTSSVGSAPRKDPSAPAAVADGLAPPPAAIRAPASSGTSGRPASSGALATTAGGRASPGAARSTAKLDDAARSAKMLREQLNTAVN